MAIKFRKQAVKFIEKADPDTLIRIREKLGQLLTSVEEQSIIPFTELDIKQMKREWEGFYGSSGSVTGTVFLDTLCLHEIP